MLTGSVVFILGNKINKMILIWNSGWKEHRVELTMCSIGSPFDSNVPGNINHQAASIKEIIDKIKVNKCKVSLRM
jgi:hypothetical protein